jgi:N12 class adenine-specific DNA methylase/superfamily I DNA/RNA helicase
MGRYGGWGAADAVFAPGASGNDLRDRERLRAVLARLGGSEEAGERLFRSAGLTVLNAHYTDPMLVGAIYQALAKLGLDQGTVVEPGAGSGQFAAFAPAGIRITGVELDTATALIAQLLHPDAEILTGSVSDPRFARVRDQSAAPVRVPRDTADGFVGNVPFSDVKWPDEVLNPGTRFSLHDHAIRWGVTRVAPGGLCAFITSRYTADAVNPRFRRTLAGELDLIGMVRLPSTAHKRMAGTAVVTDIIIGRRIADGERPLTSPETWEQSRPLAIGGSSQTARVNTYFHDNPRHILGTLQPGGMYRADDFAIAPSGDLEQQLGAALGEIAGRAVAAGQRHEPRPAARPVIEILSRRPDGTITAQRDGTFTQVVHGQDVPLAISSDREADQTRKLVALAEARSALIRAEASCPEDTDEIDAMRSRMGELYDAYAAAYGPIGRFTTRTVTYHIKTLEGVLDRLDFSRKDVPDPEVKLLEAYLGRDALTRIVRSAADPGQVRHSTRKDKHGETVTVATQLVETAKVRAALTAALARLPQGADAEVLTATFGERMSRIETGEQRTRLMPAAFRSDPRRPAVEALETFDPVTQTAVKKPVFSRRTAMPHRMELGADTPQEALDLVLIHRRRVDLGEIARLLGTDEADARAQLGTLVFDDPAAGGLVAAAEYLSGNVREKLAAARTAADSDPERYNANVESLQAVQPPTLAAEDIQARLGSAWLSREIVQEGLRYVLEDPRLTVIHPGGSEWKVESRTARNSRAQDTYGTSDWNALDLAGALLTNASITVRRTTIDPVTGAEKSYRDDAATLFAFRKAQRLDADFVSWLWSDPGRADECVRLYNSAYNNQVKRVWDSSPFYIPGLAPGMKLHPFQNAMVRRLHTESGMAAWVVGSGKTELGITAAMEGARLGRHRLTAIVTPASLVNQWRDRIYRTFPEARVLVADDDLRGRKDSREVFAERAASGDYQLAITPYEFFGSLPLSADAARASVDEEIDKLTRYAEEATAQGDRYTAKDLQGKIAKLEAKYSAAVKASGGAAGFTDTGIDSVVVDEWHNFRRIRRDSNNRLLAMPGSGRANHMLAVFDYLRKHHPEGLRLGLSGTPLEQSIADAWAAMRFFTPDRLKELGLEEFDAFLTTFGRTEPRREPTPTGSGLHVRERQADWFNLPDMRRTLWDPFADVVRRADLGLNLPRLAGGRPQTHVLPQTPGQAHMQADIDGRYEMFKAGDREGDNHILKLMDQAGKNALHPRMLGMETDGKIKLEVWADHAAAWYHATKDTGFLDRDGNPHPVPGALRMVACELGVPDPARPNAWSVYSEMRSLLAARGVPAGAIRFAQDADNDRKKAALWEDARTGRCNFIIGSAQTAGTGVDVPDRLQVLDYMTLSWNPTQFEQWLGRIVRQGNQNPEVAAHVWATEGTIEVLRADKISMKSAPFEALLDGTSETRRLTEEDDNPISAWAAEMTARMSGNPLLTSQREAQLEVDTAQGMQNEWQRENGVKARRLAVMDKEIQELEAENAAIDDALSRAIDTKGDKFAARVGTGHYTVRAEAGAALIAALTATAAGDVSTLTGGNPQHLAELAGFPVTARYNRVTVTVPAPAEDGQETGQDAEPAERTLITLGLEGVPQGQVSVIDAGDLPGRDPAALITSLEDRIRRLPGHKEKNTAAIASNRDQITKTRAELAQPSPYLQQLADARDALDRIEAQINEQIKDDTPAPDAAQSGAGERADANGTDATTEPPAAFGTPDLGQEPAGTGTSPPPEPETGQQPPRPAEPAPVPADDPGPDGSTEAAASATAPAAGDVASLPPWTAGSPHSAAITATYQAALADSDLTQAARGNHLDRFLQVMTDWVSSYAAGTTTDDSQVPPLALTVLDDPVFAADLACAVGAAVHASRVGQAPPPRGSQIPPEVTRAALSHWQEEDEATARAAATDQWRDIETAAQIDIWLSRAGLPRQGRQVRWHPGGHAVVELTAADGEQWRLHVPHPQDAQHEATARYSLTRSGRDGWSCLLNGTPGSTTPQQAAALLTGTLEEENALLPAPAATSAQDQAAPAAVQVGHAVSAASATPVADKAADGDHPGSPGGTEKPDAGQVPLGSGLTREDLDFAYQHAYEYALGTSRDPDPGQEERALDYATWYLAEYRDEESMAGLPDHRHAWARFADQGYPAREPARTASGQRDQGRPETGATAEAVSPPGHAGPEPPAAAGSTVGLRRLAAAHGLAAATVKTGGTLMTTVHDDARTVLLHDDISGTRVGGQRLDPGEVPAYLAAYVRHPQLPPRCLADLARYDPGEPAPLTLTPARETAARHGLEVRIRRVSGQSYITFCEPGTNGTPILSYPAGAASAHHGPCAVPVTVIGGYLAAYRESVPAAMFTVPEPRDWGRRVAPLTPHLVDGSSHFIPAARDRLRAALAAARGDDIAEARRLLGEAEELTPVTLAPEREAELTAAIRRHTARYGHTEDPAAYLATASPRVLDASERELGWVRAYIADHPEVREHPEAGESAAGPGSDREAAVRVGQQAKEAFESGDHQRALALIDDAELRYPNPAIHWDAARDQLRAAISKAAPGNPPNSQLPRAQAPAAGEHAGAGTTAVAASAAADAPPAGSVSGTDTEESAAAPTAAAPEPGTDSPSGDPDAEHLQPGSTATEPAPAGPGAYYEARVADHPQESVTWAATTEGRASAEAHARSHSARSDRLWEVRHVPVGPDAAPAVIARYRLGFLQLDDAALRPATGQAAAAEAAPGTKSRPPEGTQPLAGHTGWAGNLRPERLLYADGTPLTIRGQGEDSDQALPATAAGVIPAPADSDYGPGRLQVVRWDDGRYETVHPALASPRGTDPYDGLGDRDRARWAAFDLAEAWPTTTAGLLPHLVDPGDVVEVERGPRSHTVDLREVRSVERGTGPYAGGLEFKIRRSKTTLYYPDNRLVPVRIPDAHPALAAAIRAALAAGPGQPETASPAASQAAADAPDTAASAAAPGSLAEAPGPAEPDPPGRYSGRIRISLESGPPVVSGTSYDDPAELREALRANFTWRKKRQLWEYTGRSTGPLEAVEAIRAVLTRLDREPAAPAGKEFPPTPQQQAILDAFLDGKDIAVQALAGTGKTTTLVLLARALMDRSPDVQVVYTAFNADIVADARRGRFGRNVTAMTMHSIARQALLQTSYAGKVNSGDQGARWPEQWASVLEIADITAPGNEPVPAEEIARLVIATVRKFRESADDEPGRLHLPGHLSAVGSPLARSVLSYARKAWADIADPGNTALLAAGRALRVDHDDYLKVWALSRPRINAGVIFFDEAQDVNAVMRQVILDQPAQTIVVGDSHQSIYGFRGAIDALRDWPADAVLPLTQSWRFGPDAADFGNLFLRSLGSRLLLEGNPALETRLGRADNPDAILCRTNATAVAEVFAGLESGKRVALAGGGQAIREIAKAARDLQAGKGTKHPDLSRFTDWDEVRQYAQNEEDGKSLQVFVRLVDRHGPGGLIDMIGRLTPEGDARNPPQLTISTAHKAKGRQWPVVRIAGDFRGPVTDPETGEVTWPSPEERRLAYVAATRAQTLMEIGSLAWIYDHPQASTRGQDAGRQHAAQLANPPAAGPVPQPGPAIRPAAPEAAAADAATQPQPPSAGETPAPGTSPAAPQPGPAASAPPTASSQPQTVSEAATADETGTHPGHEEPVGNGPAEPEASPLTNSDLADELRHLPGFARWLSQVGASPVGGDLDSQRPGAGSSAVCDERGIEITVSGPGFSRHGLVTWPRAASWIDNGVTPARLGLAVIADRLSTFCRDHRDQLITAGTCDPDATDAELGQIRDTAVAMIVDAALRSRGAAVPVPPARPEDPAWYTTVMTTRPARGAGKAENAVLERLTQVRTLIREPQPATAAEIRATLRWRIGYSLADMIRALDDPAAVRAWINDQASLPVPDGYDNSGERWYGTSPDGLITDRNGDDRAPSCIRWEDIPAWIRPGITSSLRDRLLAAADASSAVFRRTVSAAVRQDPGAAPGEEEDKQARQHLREATDAAWAAIEAAPPPSSADLDRARHDYRDWRPVQQALFDDLPQDTTRAQDGTRTAASRPPRPAQSGPASSTGNVRPAAKAAAPQQEPATHQDPPSPAAEPAADAGKDNQRADRPDQRTSPEPHQPAPPPKTALARAPETTPQDPTTAHPTSAGPAHGEDPEPPQAPATNSDLAIALHSMSDQELTSFLTLGKTPDGHGSLTNRRKGLPDAGASQMLNFDRAGVRITVRSRGFHRHGQITWRQVASWIDTGLTPARLGIIIAASGLHIFTYARRDELIAVGKDNIDAAIRELNQISTDAIDAALSTALSARDADAPVPPARSGKPSYRTMAMLTGPDPSATPEENTALARIAELGAAIRGTQPVTPADIRTTIRWWIGDSLPEYARALASPEAMRGWIRRQASGPASRPGHGTYDNGRYYSACPEGLRTSQGSDTRAAPWILWEEIPAWTQPGLSASLRDRLAAAEPRPASGRTRTAAARPSVGVAAPAGQADDPLPGPLREAIDAAWAAIEAAPPPTPADLDHARTVYRAAGTVQQDLPDSPAKTGQPGRTVAPAPRPRAEPRPAPPPLPAPAARRQDELPAAAAAGMPAGTGTGTRREPAALPQPPAIPDPLTDDDIFLGISRLPAFVIGDLFHAIDTGQPLKSVGRQLRPYSGERAAGEPDPGARETVSAEPAGIRIQVAPTGSRRTGLITWAQIDDLLRPGLTPGRRQIAVQAWQVRVGFMAANASFRAVGEGRLAAAAEDELRAQAAAAVTAILAAAHPAIGGPASQVTDEAATIERIAALAAALPSQPPRSRTPAGEVTTGDVIGHPGYKFQPFRVSAPPRQTDTAVEITGRLTEPAGTEPAGPITLTLPCAGRPGAVVSVIPVPARSLRPLFPGHDAAAGTGQPADARANRADRTPVETAGAPSDVVPAPDAEIPASQPHAPQTPSQERTMPPAAHSTAPSESLASAEASAAPQPSAAAPALVPPETGGQRDAGHDAPGSHAATRPGDGASLTDELERVLDAIRQRRGAAADGHANDDDFSDIRSAFAAMRDALGLSAASPEAGPGQPTPGLAAAASRPPRGEPGPAADGFTDIQAAFADLRDILGLPARGRHARSDGPPDGSDASVADALDQAAAEAQACARWYRDTPEWQRISTVGRAARDLITAIREAVGDYWAEIRLDIRVRGFARTLAARTALAVSGAAHVLAGRLERAGHRDSRIWRAAWRLHQATTTFANRVMRYTPPGRPDGMREARRIIDDLGQRQNRSGQPGPGRHAASRSSGGTRTPNAAALASASFPVMVNRANARQASAAPAARTAVPAPRQPATRRQ